MNKKLFLSTWLLLINSIFFAQAPIDVTEQTIKIGALDEVELLYGFAQGDQIVFNFNEINGKELKELQVVEFPKTSKFSDFKTKKIENKVLNVDGKSVYKFKFYNSALSGRVCKIKIQRIPKEDKSKSFNTSIKWVSKQDTTWNVFTKDVLIRYDSVKIPNTKKVLISSEVKEEVILDKIQRVHSKTNENGNKTVVFFVLPNNIISDYGSKNIIAWAYWVGVGEESNIAWKNNQKIIAKAVKQIAGLTMSPLGTLAIGAVAELALPTIGEDVSYGLVDETNKNLFFSGMEYRGFDFGKGIVGYKSFVNQNILQGKYFIVLTNDNLMQGINVMVKVSAIVEYKKFKDEKYFEYQVTPIYEKKIIKEPVINTIRIPVTAD